MAESATKTRDRDYWTVDLRAEGIGRRRFTATSEDQANDIVLRWFEAFGGTAYGDFAVRHVRSYK